MTYEDDKKEKIRVRTIKLAFTILTILFFLTLVGFAWVLNDVQSLTQKTANLTKANGRITRTTAHLTVENSKRIKEIQISRASSCRQTYRGVRKVVEKLLPKHPTPVQKANTQKFEGIIHNLIEGCKAQTKPKLRGS